jgi:hypothetical protein
MTFALEPIMTSSHVVDGIVRLTRPWLIMLHEPSETVVSPSPIPGRDHQPLRLGCIFASA